MSPAALAILQAALPIEATMILPLPLREVKAGLLRASLTADSGNTALIASSMIARMSCIRLGMSQIPPYV